MTEQALNARLLSLEECRKILGDRCSGWSDAELERHVEHLEGLARWCFDEVDRRRAVSPRTPERRRRLHSVRESA